MRMRHLIAASAFFLCSAAMAQSPEVSRIRALYGSVNKDIADCRGEFTMENPINCRFYRDVLVSNEGLLPKCGSGRYRIRTTWFYEDCEEDGVSVAKVHRSGDIAANHKYEEYLYDGKDLVFYFSSLKNAETKEPAEPEIRMYFKKGSLVHVEPSQLPDLEERKQEVLEDGRRLRELPSVP